MLFITATLIPASGFASLHIVTTIKPLAWVAQGVSDDSVRVTSLMDQGANPHHFTLRPSQLKALQTADLIIWLGPQAEPYLAKRLSHPSFQGKVIDVMQLEGIKTLPYRDSFAPSHAGHRHRHAHHVHEPSSVGTAKREERSTTESTMVEKSVDNFVDDGRSYPVDRIVGNNIHKHSHDQDSIKNNEKTDGYKESLVDLHLWLDVNNMSILAQEISEYLSKARPESRVRYAYLATDMAARLGGAQRRWATRFDGLSQLRTKESFVELHDAFNYFNDQWQLAPSVVISIDGERQPTIRETLRLKAQIRRDNARCVIVDSDRYGRWLLKLFATPPRVVVIDPMGADLNMNDILPQHRYEHFIEQIVRRYETCLQGSSPSSRPDQAS